MATDTACGQASNATLALLHVRGLDGARADCSFETVEALSGGRYRVVEQCAEIGTDEVFRTAGVWEILTPESFRRTADSGWQSAMRYCAQASLPEGWREIDLEAAIHRE
ncbi:MAG: hypothetical protein H3C57_05785 [Gammaproteobacteria bacterium]|nr:hypothetical protein [Gammaproteobacteria bacterium]